MENKTEHKEEIPFDVVSFFRNFYEWIGSACRRGHNLNGRKMSRDQVMELVSEIRRAVYVNHIKPLRSDRDQLKAQVEELKARTEDLRTELYNEKSGNAMTELELKQDIDSLKAEKLTLESQWRASINDRDNLRNDVDELTEETETLKSENARLREALEYVIKTIERSDEWWMDCPDKGGFDINKIKSALKK